MTDHPDYFRSLDAICQADPRSTSFAVIAADGVRTKTLEDHQANIAEVHLTEDVPEEIVVQFETAKNVFLYSWFVYRFGPVAELYAYTTLELALRTCFGIDGNALGPKSPQLKRLLTRAVAEGKVRAEQFSVIQRLAESRARQRAIFAHIQAASEAGVEEVEWDDANIAVQPEDIDHGYLDQLVEVIPYLRNNGAHGSRRLDNAGLSALGTVGEIINQLFSPR